MQEQVDREAIAIALKANKLTAKTLWTACRAVLRQIAKAHHQAQTPTGRQSVKKLMNHDAAIHTIPLDGDTKLFEKVAQKWRVDYSFHKVDKDKYLLLFKSGQADAITAAFSDFSAQMMKREQDKRPHIRDLFQKSVARATRQKQNKTHQREREAMRNDR